ncbi:hypothetical protein HDU97_005943 [Phlyctochytrium planicorne]|nr:hypothetical protein HDU97_005943 [Phlyctochytrium planicorne]
MKLSVPFRPLTLLLLICALVLCGQVSRVAAEEHSNYGDYKQAAKIMRENWKLHHQGDDSKAPEGDDLYVFFSMYDHNHDAHLDGHELRHAFTEIEIKVDEARNGPDENGKWAKDRLTIKEVESLIDHILEEDDGDNDGMISWEEYLQSQKAHHQS